MADVTIENIAAELKAGDTKLEALLAKQEEEIEKSGKTTAETRKAIKEAGERHDSQIQELEAKYKHELGVTSAELKKAVDRISEVEKSGKRGGIAADDESATLGQQFCELIQKSADAKEDSFLAMRDGTRRGGGPTLVVKGLRFHRDVVRKANLLTDAATRLAAPYRDATLPLIARTLRMRSLMDVVPISTNAVEYVEMTGFGAETGTTVTITTSGTTATVSHSTHGFKTFDRVKISGANEADLNKIARITVTSANAYTYTIVSISDAAGTGTITARNMSRHGGAAGVSEGSAKPEAHMTFTLQTALVQTIAHWLPASRQVLDDLPQLQAMVDNELTYGLGFKEDIQLLYGTGTAPQIQGIMTHGDVQAYTAVSTDKKLIAVRKAATLVQIAELQPDGVVVHPTDWQDIELATGEDGHFIWVSTAANGIGGGGMNLWRMPVVVTTSMDSGDFLVGAFGGGGMTLYDREQANVRFSESHASYFTSNLLAILAEERIAVAWKRPEAFVAGDFGSST